MSPYDMPLKVALLTHSTDEMLASALGIDVAEIAKYELMGVLKSAPVDPLRVKQRLWHTKDNLESWAEYQAGLAFSKADKGASDAIH